MIRAARALAVAVGTGLGAGFAPIAPGTVGSAVGVVCHLPLAGAGPLASAAAIVPLFLAGIWAARVCGEIFGAHDHRRIVIDEIVGQLIALAGIPARGGWLLAGFLLFRAFDIVKPPPAGRIDRRWGTPLGVMADDVVAGLYANLALRVARAILEG